MIKIDAFNKQILQTFENNAKIPNTELADKIGLSPSACLRRVQELEASGVIKAYRATFDKELMGIGFIAFVMVGLSEHTKAAQEDFESAIVNANEVKECHNVTGSCEYMLRVETKDLKAYKLFHTDVLGSLDQVATITTHVVMESVKD